MSCWREGCAGWSSARWPSTTPVWPATLAATYPGRVAVGIDYRLDADGRTEVAVRGWEQGSGRTVAELLADLEGAGVAAVIVTAIDRDGMLTGPDVDGLRQVLASTDIPVIASGGVASVADIETLAGLEVPAVGRPAPGERSAGWPGRSAAGRWWTGG